MTTLRTISPEERPDPYPCVIHHEDLTRHLAYEHWAWMTRGMYYNGVLRWPRWSKIERTIELMPGSHEFLRTQIKPYHN